MDQLLPLVYDQLRALAQELMRQERSDHTIHATPLVHEAYLTLVGQKRVQRMGAGCAVRRRGRILCWLVVCLAVVVFTALRPSTLEAKPIEGVEKLDLRLAHALDAGLTLALPTDRKQAADVSRCESVLTPMSLMPDWLASSEAIAEPEERQPTTGPNAVAGKSVAHWTKLPLLWEKANEYGFDLPNPLGLTGNFYFERQDFEIVDLKVGFGDKLLKIDKLVLASDVKTKQAVWNARFDTWLLPFLNLYGILGYMDGRADIKLGPLGIPVYDLKLRYEGLTLGGGCTLAGGFRPFEGRPTILFGLVDLNYTKTFLSFDKLGLSLDGGVETIVFSSRLGVRERIATDSSLGDLHLSLWGGVMWQGVQSILPGRIESLGLDFTVRQEARDSLNLIFGGRLEIAKHSDVMVEIGLGGRQSLLLAFAFRF